MKFVLHVIHVNNNVNFTTNFSKSFNLIQEGTKHLEKVIFFYIFKFLTC